MTLCLSQIEEQARVVNRHLGVGVKAVGEWSLELPLHIKNGCNLREHPMARHRRVKKERNNVGWALLSFPERPRLPCVVTLTRLAARSLDDDNLAGGFKAVRDGVAEWLRVNDNDPRVTWRYAQEKHKGYACRIAIEEAT